MLSVGEKTRSLKLEALKALREGGEREKPVMEMGVVWPAFWTVKEPKEEERVEMEAGREDEGTEKRPPEREMATKRAEPERMRRKSRRGMGKM